MAVSRRIIYAVDSRAFVSPPPRQRRSTLADSLGVLTGEPIGIDLHFVESDDQGRFIPAALGALEVTLKLQRFDRPPTGGQVSVTYKTEESELFDVDASLFEVECALNAVNAIADEGGVEVLAMVEGANLVIQPRRPCASPPESRWFIRWKEVGERAPFTINDHGIFPPSYSFQPIIHSGTVSTPHLSSMHFHEQRLAQVQASGWSVLPDASLTVEHRQTGDGVRHSIQRIKIDPPPWEGTFTIRINDAETCNLSVHASAKGVCMALVDAFPAETFAVRKIGVYHWEIEWLTVGAQNLLDVSNHTLVSNQGLHAELEWNDPLLHMIAMACPDGAEIDAEISLTDTTNNVQLTMPREPVVVRNSLT